MLQRVGGLYTGTTLLWPSAYENIWGWIQEKAKQCTFHVCCRRAGTRFYLKNNSSFLKAKSRHTDSDRIPLKIYCGQRSERTEIRVESLLRHCMWGQVQKHDHSIVWLRSLLWLRESRGKKKQTEHVCPACWACPEPSVREERIVRNREDRGQRV